MVCFGFRNFPFNFPTVVQAEEAHYGPATMYHGRVHPQPQAEILIILYYISIYVSGQVPRDMGCFHFRDLSLNVIYCSLYKLKKLITERSCYCVPYFRTSAVTRRTV